LSNSDVGTVGRINIRDSESGMRRKGNREKKNNVW